MKKIAQCSLIALLATAAFACTKAPEEKPTPEQVEAPAPKQADEPAKEPQEEPSLPKTDIYLFPVSMNENGVSLGELKNISQKPLYDNQPFFIPDTHNFYYSSMAENGKTDIWHYDITNNTHKQITNTPEKSEYSPQHTPSGTHLSVIQENEDAGGQKVFRYNFEGLEGVQTMELNPVGYYAWNAAEDKLFVFALGEPHTLRHIDLVSGEITIVYENIDRALYALPDRSGAIFTAPKGDGYSALKVDFETKEVTPLFDLPGQAQDYLIFAKKEDLSNPIFWSIHEEKLYQRTLQDDAWNEIVDLSEYYLSGATRMAISDDHQWLTIVADATHRD